MKKRPNILFLFTDDQRHETIRALGNQHIHTPNLDRLVEGGSSFTRAYIPGGSCAAVCMPSRAMLHTGRSLFHLEGAGETIPQAHALLGETLRQAGYHCHGIGKWHNGTESYARSFVDGAEIFFGGMDDHWNVPACRFDPSGVYGQRHPIVRQPFRSNEVEHRICDHIVSGKHSSELFSDAAVDFLGSYRRDQPFFLYLSYMAPHDPRTMPERFLRMYDPATIELPENFLPQHPFDLGRLRVRDELLAGFPRKPMEIRRHLAEYYAMITHLDFEIGRVLRELERTDRIENTIILLAGDNGLAIGQHGLMGKQSCYDHSVHVPLVLRGPGIPKDRRFDDFVYLMDIFPTLCELSGTTTPDTVEGVSLCNALRGRQGSSRLHGGSRSSMFFAYEQFQRSVRDERFKLIEYAVRGKRTTQLFDLNNDPREMENLASQSAAAGTLERLRGELVKWKNTWNDEASPWGRNFWSNCTC
jgi:arylsulfatase A-like enzyme